MCIACAVHVQAHSSSALAFFQDLGQHEQMEKLQASQAQDDCVWLVPYSAASDYSGTGVACGVGGTGHCLTRYLRRRRLPPSVHDGAGALPGRRHASDWVGQAAHGAPAPPVAALRPQQVPGVCAHQRLAAGKVGHRGAAAPGLQACASGMQRSQCCEHSLALPLARRTLLQRCSPASQQPGADSALLAPPTLTSPAAAAPWGPPLHTPGCRTPPL